MVWSPELTLRFMENMEQVKPQRWYGGYSAWSLSLLPFAYFFPLDMISRIHERLKKAPIFDKVTRNGLPYFEAVWNFRREMLAAFEDE